MERTLGSSSEAAKTLHINTEAFRQRWKRGRLPFKPVGELAGRLMWDLDEVRRHYAMPVTQVSPADSPDISTSKEKTR